MDPNTKRRAEAAAHQFRLADRLERKRPIDFSEVALNPLRAEQAREEGTRLLKPPDELTGDARTELVPSPTADESLTESRMQFLDTLANPTSISVAASEQRADLAQKAGVLPAAIDAAVSAQAEGSIEKMLCHQIAAMHATGMGLLARVADNPSMSLGDAARVVGAATRSFEAGQNAALVLQKLKQGGTQRVVVQYQQRVHVEAGGQAVVAGKMKRGSRIGGRVRK